MAPWPDAHRSPVHQRHGAVRDAAAEQNAGESASPALQVCALWHAEMWLRGGGGCVVVEGLSHMTNRFTAPCVVCGRMVRCRANLNRLLDMVSARNSSYVNLHLQRQHGGLARKAAVVNEACNMFKAVDQAVCRGWP